MKTCNERYCLPCAHMRGALDNHRLAFRDLIASPQGDADSMQAYLKAGRELDRAESVYTDHLAQAFGEGE